MTKKSFSIAGEYTAYPGPRYISDGEFSGEDFRKKILEELYLKFSTIAIELDGTYGYPSSFLEEAFGGLKRLYPKDDVLKKFEFISNENPLLIDEIRSYVKDALK